MANYGGNYQFTQSPSASQQQQQQPQQQQFQYGQPPPQQQQQQQMYGMQYSPPPQGQGQGQFFNPHGSLATMPGRMPPRRSLSLSSAQAAQQQMAMSSFDPYASTTTAPPATGSGQTNFGPPSFANEQMTTSPHSQMHYAQPPQQQFDPTASIVSDITMFTNSPFAASTTQTALVPAPGTNLVPAPAPGAEGEFSEGSYDPAVIAEQEQIWQEIQDRRKMERIRADSGNPNHRAIIPRNGTTAVATRQTPGRTRSLPHPNSRSQKNSVARGGVAVLDPKKDMRKQTRKMKTASGAVGGAVVGGLILGPVGVVLGASGGAAAANKMAKSRDKRKQQQFEQKSVQRGAAHSVAAKGDGAFV